MGLLSRRHEGKKKKEHWRLDKMGNDDLSNIIISGTQWEKKILRILFSVVSIQHEEEKWIWKIGSM